MKLIFDFDHTVFDMSEMHLSIKDAMVKLGVKEDHYQELYNEVTHWKLFTQRALGQRIQKHYNIHSDEVVKVLDGLAKESALYIYDDVTAGFDQLKEKGHKILLLSWGSPEWQDKKIQHSGIMHHCEEVVSIPEIKAAYLKEHHPHHECLVLIDDKPAELKAVQESEPNMKLVRIRRENGKYSDIETPPGIPEAKNMQEVVNLIATMKCTMHEV